MGFFEAPLLKKRDINNAIYIISPEDTPIKTLLPANIQATSLEKHEFIGRELRAPNKDNAAIPGSDAGAATHTAPVAGYNYCQEFRESVEVPRNEQESQYYGIKNPIAEEKAIALKQIARDIEAAYKSANTKVLPVTKVTAGKLDGIMTICTTNKNSTYAKLLYNGTTDLGQDAVDEMLMDIYNEGGRPSHLFVGGTQKRAVSKWDTRVSNTLDGAAMAKKGINTLRFYESDAGVIEVVNHWNMAVTDAIILDKRMWYTAKGKAFKYFPLAATSSTEKGYYEGSCTLICGNEKSSGIFTALSATDPT
jgi:hypothetical protein